MAKQKFYVVWNGRKKGVFTSWDTCKKQISNFEGAQYKSFVSKEAAENAFKENYRDYVGKDTKTIQLSAEELKKIGKPLLDSIAVDAACAGNPGKMEYRGVDTKTKRQLFIQGPFEQGTNNIGEFLALVHGLGYLKQKNSELPIYSDSKIAISWVKKGQCRTNLQITSENKPLFDFVKRAEKWLKDNTYTTKILKWETKAWGEIPADFGRK
ncbi:MULTISPECIES: ribonuclease H1 domain-containing protein [Flavobacteriaceae]|uniref:Ribonuclease H n=2 Tax=Flavobacteriaceae TaxID=49546 RepID=A0A4Y8ASU6_9FLAO|nr:MULTISPECIES: ribonuclease H family protein [Flavobacteriaceae]TEW73748.1 ribonuclease H [Gramella jeungdoensis]GGK37225.1 ribonuclease H [Lutibacter litoralis]